MRQRTFRGLLLGGLLFTGLAILATGCASGDYSGSASVSMYGYYGYHDPMYYGYGAPVHGVPVPPPGMVPPPGGMPPGARPPAPPPQVSQLPSRPMPAPAPRPMPARGGGGGGRR
jgi:hypothetical protein